MPKRFRRRFDAVDHREVIATYPPPPEYFETHYYMEPERIERLQLTRLQEECRRAYDEVPFYEHRWAGAGFEPSDIATLDDLNLIPIYNIDDWFVIVERRGDRDEMIVQVETRAPATDYETLRDQLEDRLRSQLEIKILVEIVSPGSTDGATGKGVVGTLRRIRDDRPK